MFRSITYLDALNQALKSCQNVFCLQCSTRLLSRCCHLSCLALQAVNFKTLTPDSFFQALQPIQLAFLLCQGANRCRCLCQRGLNVLNSSIQLLNLLKESSPAMDLVVQVCLERIKQTT